MKKIFAAVKIGLLVLSIFSVLPLQAKAESIDFVIDLLVTDKLQYNIGETVHLYARILNTGTVKIETAYANFTVIDPSGNVVAKRDRQDWPSLPPGFRHDFFKLWTIPGGSMVGLYRLDVSITAFSGVWTGDSVTKSQSKPNAFAVGASYPGAKSVVLKFKTTDGLYNNIGDIYIAWDDYPPSVQCSLPGTSVTAYLLSQRYYVLGIGPTKEQTGGVQYAFDHWETIGGVSVDFPDSQMTWITITANGELMLVFRTPAPPSEYTIYLRSRTTDGQTNVGTITLDGLTYSLPSDTTKPAGSYQTTGNPPTSYSFDSWEVSGGINVANPVSQTTTVTVTSSGTLKAVFKPTPSEVGTLSGRVTDSATGFGIGGATVTASGPSSGSATSDVDGYYTIPSLTPGSYSVTATKLGYEAQTQTTTIDAGQTTELNFQLLSVPLDWDSIAQRAEKRREIYELFYREAFNQTWWYECAMEKIDVSANLWDPWEWAAKFLFTQLMPEPVRSIVEYELFRQQMEDIVEALANFISAKDYFDMYMLVWYAHFQMGSRLQTDLKSLIEKIDLVISTANASESVALEGALKDEKSLMETIYQETVEFDNWAFYGWDRNENPRVYPSLRKHVEFLRYNLELNYFDMTHTLGAVKNLREEVQAPLADREHFLNVAAHSPVSLLLTDPEGKRVGFDIVSQQIVNEIVNASYTGPDSEPEIIQVPIPLVGNYRIDAYGNDTGEYTIAIDSVASDGSIADSETWSGTITLGETDTSITQLYPDGTFAHIRRVPLDYSTIQEAINTANVGDIVYVYNGTYCENVVVNKTVSLIGEDPSTTIIDGNYVTIVADNVKLSGFRIQHCARCVFLGSSNCLISQNIFANSGEGLYSDDPMAIGYPFNNPRTDNIIIGNLFENNGYGIHCYYFGSNSIIGNVIVDNGIGLHMDVGADNNIYHNDFINNTCQASLWSPDPSYPSHNVWDDGYPSGGNYWSDYTGVDYYSGPFQNMTGSDGIGDTSYIIDEDNQDRYPLMSLMPSQPKIQRELYYDDGTNEGSVGTGPETHLAVRFSLPSGWTNAKLLKARFFLFFAGMFKVHVFSEDGVTELIPPLMVASPSYGWFDVDLSRFNIIVLGDFYISREAADAMIGLDTTPPLSGRSYWLRPGSWIPESQGDYMIRAVVGRDPSHSIAVNSIRVSKDVVGHGFPILINVTIANYGDFEETFDVTVYANTTEIEKQTVTLTSGNSTTITFTWNTTGVIYGNYTLSVCATPVLGEMDTTDNTLIDGWIVVTLVGDVDGDFDCDADDVFTHMAPAYGTKGPPKKYPADPNYNPNCDFDGDGDVDADDVFTYLAPNYGKKA